MSQKKGEKKQQKLSQTKIMIIPGKRQELFENKPRWGLDKY